MKCSNSHCQPEGQTPAAAFLDRCYSVCEVIARLGLQASYQAGSQAVLY